MVDENIFALIISGTPSAEDLTKAWEEICCGYEDAIGNNEHKLYLNLYKEVAVLSATYEQIQFLIGTLSTLNENKLYSAYFYGELNRLLKTNFSFSNSDKELNEKYLHRCYSRSKGIKLHIDMKQTQLSGLVKRQDDGKKPTREYYQSILISLSDHARYPVTDSITVYEYCERVRRFNKYYEELKKKTNGSSK